MGVDLFQEVGGAGQLGFFDFAGADDENGAVDSGGDDGGIGDDADGGGIEEDHVVLGFELVDQAPEGLGHQHFGWIGRDRAGGQDREIGDFRVLDESLGLGAADDGSGQALAVRKAEAAVDRGAAQVGVDQEDAAAGLGVGDGQVGYGDGLPFRLLGGGDRDGLELFVEHGKLDIRAGDLVGLGDFRQGVVMRQEVRIELDVAVVFFHGGAGAPLAGGVSGTGRGREAGDGGAG